MPNYTPIHFGVAVKSSQSMLLDFRWRMDGITSDFLIPGDESRTLRVEFERVEVVRLLDEMALSTESETTAINGLVPNHLAYLVDGSLFWSSQSEALKTVHPTARNYRFITGWVCVDVISTTEPSFTVTDVPREGSGE